MEELSKRLNEVKRKLEKQNEGPRKRLETNERWSFGEVCPTKEMSTQRSPDDAPKVEEPHKRTASSGERFPTLTLSASTSSDLGPSPATGYTDESTIPVKSDKDQRRCFITGMVAIFGTQLMLADKSNMCIKLLDLERGTVIGVKVLPSAPHDVTCVPGSRVAVTIPAFHQIHVFTADQILEQCGIMGIDGICSGIHCSGDRLFVSCEDPPLVQILNMEGDIINTIQLYLIKYPTYLTCSPDNKFIYVSDFDNDTVTSMDMAGSVQWRFKCRLYTSAGRALRPGVCTGDGCIYICSVNMIHVVSPSGTKLAVIPFSLEGGKSAAVCYNSQERTLYVSRFSNTEEENNYISRISMH